MNIHKKDLVKASERWDIPLNLLKHWYRIYAQDNGQEKLSTIAHSYKMMARQTAQSKKENALGINEQIDRNLYKRCMVFMSENLGIGKVRITESYADIGLPFIKNKNDILERREKENKERAVEFEPIIREDVIEIYNKYKAGELTLLQYNNSLSCL